MPSLNQQTRKGFYAVGCIYMNTGDAQLLDFPPLMKIVLIVGGWISSLARRYTRLTTARGGETGGERSQKLSSPHAPF